MDDPKYEYAVVTKRLLRPIGNLEFIAKPRLFTRLSPTSAPEVTAPNAEMYGATEEEAKSRVDAFMTKWIADKSGAHKGPDK